MEFWKNVRLQDTRPLGALFYIRTARIQYSRLEFVTQYERTCTVWFSQMYQREAVFSGCAEFGKILIITSAKLNVFWALVPA